MAPQPKTNPMKGIDPGLAKLGFVRIRPQQIRRVSMEVSGKTKSGKSRLVLTMTPPIGVLNTDRSLLDLLNLPEFAGLDVVVKDFSDRFTPGEPLSQKGAQSLEAEFARVYRSLYEARGVRSIGVTKWTTLWEVARYAEFGSSSARAHHYVPVNLRMRGYLAEFQKGDKNLILEQDLKEEWIGDKPTGRYIIDGFKYTPGLVQVNASMWREEDEDQDFKLKITGCSLDASMVGHEFTNDEIDFKTMAPWLVPNTKVEDWR